MSRALAEYETARDERIRAWAEEMRREAAAAVQHVGESIDRLERRLTAEQNRFRNDDWSGGDPWLVFRARAELDAKRERLRLAMTDERMAPEGAIWICGACGKTAVDRYGMEGEHSPGWDESCMLNAILVRKDSIQRGPNGVHAEPFEAGQDESAEALP